MHILLFISMILVGNADIFRSQRVQRIHVKSVLPNFVFVFGALLCVKGQQVSIKIN